MLNQGIPELASTECLQKELSEDSFIGIELLKKNVYAYASIGKEKNVMLPPTHFSDHFFTDHSDKWWVKHNSKVFGRREFPGTPIVSPNVFNSPKNIKCFPLYFSIVMKLYKPI